MRAFFYPLAGGYSRDYIVSNAINTNASSRCIDMCAGAAIGRSLRSHWGKARDVQLAEYELKMEMEIRCLEGW